MQEFKDKIQFIDEALHPNDLYSHHLHLHLSPNGISYTIYNPEERLFSASVSYLQVSSQMHLDLIFSKDQWLHAQYQEVKVMFSNPLFTFIPDQLFDEQQIQSYLNYNLLDPDSFFQERNAMHLLQAQNIFCVNRDPKIVVNKYHPDNQVFHSSTPLIEGVLHGYGYSTETKVFIFSWNENDMEILVLNGGKLAYYNFFQVNSREEYIYFPLFVCQQLKIDRNLITLYAGGILNAESPWIVLLNTYFKNIRFTGLPASFNYSPGIYEKTGNLAWSLASLAL